MKFDYKLTENYKNTGYERKLNYLNQLVKIIITVMSTPPRKDER